MSPLVVLLVVVLCLGAFAVLLAWTTRPAESIGDQVREIADRLRRGQRSPSSRR
jgi:hypothetical protein